MYTQNAIIQEAQQGSLSVLLSCFCIYEPCMQITVNKNCVFKQLLHPVLSVIQSGEHLCSANRNIDRGDLASPQ